MSQTPSILVKRALSALAVAICLAAGSSARAADPPLVLERTIALTGVSGRIDHMAVDLARRRLIVAELGNGTVDVVDLGAGKVLHRISGLKEPQGVGYAPGSDRIVVASAGDGTVRMFSADTFAPAGVVELGDDADNVRIDPKDGQVIVGYGEGGLAVIDPRAGKVVGTVKLAAHPEAFQLSPDGGTIFVNLPDARQIAVIDRAVGKQVVTWATGDLRSNFPMALTGDGAQVVSVFRGPARLAVFDRSGATVASTPTCGDADDVYFDAMRRRLYVSCGEGAVDVLSWDGKTPTELARIPTASGARTSLFVPELDRLYVAQRAGWLGGEAAILVFRPGL